MGPARGYGDDEKASGPTEAWNHDKEAVMYRAFAARSVLDP